MICNRCGNNNRDGSAFCAYCGNKLETGPQMQPQSQHGRGQQMQPQPHSGAGQPQRAPQQPQQRAPQQPRQRMSQPMPQQPRQSAPQQAPQQPRQGMSQPMPQQPRQSAPQQAPRQPGQKMPQPIPQQPQQSAPQQGNALPMPQQQFADARQMQPQPQLQMAPQAAPAVYPHARASLGPAPDCGVRIRDDRGLLMFILFSSLTLGIYGLYFYHSMIRDINIICDGDGDETPGLLKLVLLFIVTCGIYGLFWDYNFQNRLLINAKRYNANVTESGSTILLWKIVGVLMCCLGPFISLHIMFQSMNSMARAYNEYYNL